MGGTGLEPVTPSLSTLPQVKPPSGRKAASHAEFQRERGPVSGSQNRPVLQPFGGVWALERLQCPNPQGVRVLATARARASPKAALSWAVGKPLRSRPAAFVHQVRDPVFRAARDSGRSGVKHRDWTKAGASVARPRGGLLSVQKSARPYASRTLFVLVLARDVRRELPLELRPPGRLVGGIRLGRGSSRAPGSAGAAVPSRVVRPVALLMQEPRTQRRD